MRPNHLFNQTIAISSKTGYDREGRETVGTATNVQARIQATTKQRLLPNGSMTTIVAIAYVPFDTTVEIDDKVLWNNYAYKVFGRYATPGYDGNATFIKLELIRWLQSE